MAHTLGPWRFDKPKESWEPWTIRAGDDSALMGNPQYYPWCPDNEDDWKLIAAAPELLEALERLQLTALQHNHMSVDGVTQPCDICAECEKAEVVIRKARGE